MKTGMKRVCSKFQPPKSVSRRSKITSNGAVVFRNRMRRHLMLNRNVERKRNSVLNSLQGRVVQAMLGLSLGGNQ